MTTTTRSPRPLTLVVDRSACPARRHGGAHHVRRGCICPDSREAWRLYIKRWKHGLNPTAKIDPTGSCRRVRAMVAMGWRNEDLQQLTGLSNHGITRLCQQRAVYVLRSTADAVAHAYTHAGFHPGPSALAAARARNAGYRLAIDWDDIDDPDEQPDDGTSGTGDTDRGDGDYRVELAAWRDTEIARLTTAGRTAAHIARELGVAERTVVRSRARHAAREQEAA